MRKYFAPKTVEDAIYLLNKYSGKARILAGGTDLVVHMKKDGFPSCIIDIKKIAELHFLKKNKQEYSPNNFGFPEI